MKGPAAGAPWIVLNQTGALPGVHSDAASHPTWRSTTPLAGLPPRLLWVGRYRGGYPGRGAARAGATGVLARCTADVQRSCRSARPSSPTIPSVATSSSGGRSSPKSQPLSTTLSVDGAQEARRPTRCPGPPDRQRMTRPLDMCNRVRCRYWLCQFRARAVARSGWTRIPTTCSPSTENTW